MRAQCAAPGLAPRATAISTAKDNTDSDECGVPVITHAIELPQVRRGRRSADQQRQYDDQLWRFAQAILEIQSTLEFQVSSRGWCYLLEERGLHKGDFDKAQRLINDCRKRGFLPLAICKEDDTRQLISEFRGVSEADTIDTEQYAKAALTDAENTISTAYGDARNCCAFLYEPIPWSHDLDCDLVCMVEKIDLVSLFEPICQRYRIPIANAKGWADLNLRAAIMRYLAEAEGEGRTPVLLYCGDHDPAGLLISSTLKKQFADLAGAVGWEPDNLVVDRFGLNEDFIEENGLTWIENLQTGSGSDLSDVDHYAHDKDYVQSYIARYGARKVEANALIVRPEAARNLLTSTIEQYVPLDWPDTHDERNQPYRAAATELFDALRSGGRS